MLTHTYRILLGASLALCVGAASAQTAPDSSSRLPAQKGMNSAPAAQPSAQPTDKMSTDPNAASQGTAAAPTNSDAASTAQSHHARKSVSPQHEAISPEEKSYRQALRQCAVERNESQRDACLDTAIGQRQPNG